MIGGAFLSESDTLEGWHHKHKTVSHTSSNLFGRNLEAIELPFLTVFGTRRVGAACTEPGVFSFMFASYRRGKRR